MSRMRARPDDAVVRREGRRRVSGKAFFKVGGASFGNNNERDSRADDDDDDVGFERAGRLPRGRDGSRERRARRRDGFEGFSKGRFSYHRDGASGSGEERRAWMSLDAKASFKTGDS